MKNKYVVVLFKGDRGKLIGEYDTIEEAEKEYESWNDPQKLYEERKSYLYNRSMKDFYYKPWTKDGAKRIQQKESITIYLEEVTYNEKGELINYKNGSSRLPIKGIYYSGNDFLEDYKRKHENNEN